MLCYNITRIITEQSPYIHNVAPIPPPKRKPTAADIAEKRILKVVDTIDRITGGIEKKKKKKRKKEGTSLTALFFFFFWTNKIK
jgi:hypothetical protein